MFKTLLSIALATTIFACPLLCRTSASVRVTAASPGGCCSCCHSHQEQSPADNAPPSNQDKGSSGCCQCICGGALLDVDGSHVAGVDVTFWAPVAIVEPLAAQAIAARLNASGGALQRSDGMNPGRALRCLFMTFLC